MSLSKFTTGLLRFAWLLQGSKEQQDGERPEKAKNLVPLKALSDIFVTKHLGVEKKTGELLGKLWMILHESRWLATTKNLYWNQGPCSEASLV